MFAQFAIHREERIRDVKTKATDLLPAGTLIDRPDITLQELQLAVRNHSMPLEALQFPVTPVGLHYLLIHFDVPAVDPATWALTIRQPGNQVASLSPVVG